MENKVSIYDKQHRMSDNVLAFLVQFCSILAVGILVIIIGYIVIRGVPAFDFSYLVSVKSTLKKTFGILPNIINTIYLIVITLLISCPNSIGGAIYLNEYATNQKFVRIISFTTEILAGIPSIIYGLFGMLFFGEFLGLGYSILTGVILSMGRIVAESAALLFTAGSVAALPTNWLTHIFSSGGSLTIQLYLEMEKANYDYAFVIALVLIVIVLILNYLAKWITRKFDVNKVD